MLGGIIGDIVGSWWESHPTNNYDFELFSSKNDFTDDTVCTIAIADAQLKGRDYGESLYDWCNRYPLRGYGGRFKHWLKSDDPKPYGSYGNGSAMRVSPVGWWFKTRDEVLDQARLSAACTHNHPEGIRGAQATAIAIHDCRQLRYVMKDQPISKEELLQHGIGHAVSLYCGTPQNFNLDIEKYRNKFDVSCQGTVPVALWIVLHSTSFEDAIRQAVSLGADADTLGAIVGSIAETLWEIPEWIKLKALSYLPDEMKTVVSEFRHRLHQK